MYQRGSQNQDEQGDQKDGEEGQEANVAGGMEAEEGEFVNLEIAFAYRSTHSRRKFKDRAKHAHMYMAFYLPGNIKLRMLKMSLSEPILTLRSCLGRATRTRRITTHPHAIVTRSTIRRSRNNDILGTAESGNLMHATVQAYAEPDGSTSNLQLRSKCC
jgi:hypothetical protein